MGAQSATGAFSPGGIPHRSATACPLLLGLPSVHRGNPAVDWHNAGVEHQTSASAASGDAGREDKAHLRTRLQAARREMSADDVAAAGSALRDALLQDPRLTMGATVALYYSVGEEPDTRRLLTGLWKHGVYVLLPIALPDGQLDWAPYEGPDSLAPARFGLMEPTTLRHGADALRRVSVVLCPALAVARDGTRLGKGAGYYDRALEHVGPNALTLAVIYDTEFVEHLPREPHDRPVQAIATPGGGVREL
jgi:5-formyltetrahydrofolate cyclo-ligase